MNSTKRRCQVIFVGGRHVGRSSSEDQTVIGSAEDSLTLKFRPGQRPARGPHVAR